MIRTGTKTYHEVRYPTPPILRRTSRVPEIENNYKQTEAIRTFYNTKTLYIKNTILFAEMYKNIKTVSNIVKRMLIKKYGANFGSVFSNKIMREYLGVNDNTYDWFWIWYNKDSEIRKRYSLQLISAIDDGNSNPIKTHRTRVYRAMKYNIGINLDPRTITYNAMQLTPHLKEGYSIMSGYGHKDGWILLAKSNLPYRWRGVNENNFEQSDDETFSDNGVEIPTN